jgi:hypothetical protein
MSISIFDINNPGGCGVKKCGCGVVVVGKECSCGVKKVRCGRGVVYFGGRLAVVCHRNNFASHAQSNRRSILKMQHRCNGLAIQLQALFIHRSVMAAEWTVFILPSQRRRAIAVAIDKPPLVALTGFKQSCEIRPVLAASG